MSNPDQNSKPTKLVYTEISAGRIKEEKTVVDRPEPPKAQAKLDEKK